MWQHIWGGGLFLGVSHATTPCDGVPELPLLGFLSIYAYTLYCRTTKFEVVTHCGRELVFRGVSHTHIPRGRSPSAPQFWGSIIFMRTPFIAELPNLKWQHIVGGSLFLGESATPMYVCSAPQFWGSLLFLRTPFTAELPNLKW